MSNAVEQIYVLSGTLTLTKDGMLKALRECGWPEDYRAPESGLMGDVLWDGRTMHDPREDSDDVIYVLEFPWFYGDGSGRAKKLAVRVLSHTQGRADIAVIYESGRKEGYRICDGAVTQHEVVLSLGDLV